MIRITHVLCAVDFSECSRSALACAVRVAGWYSARVTAFHVVAPSAKIAFLPDPSSLTLPATDERGLKDRLREFVGETSGSVPVQMEIHEGDACQDIVDRATGGGADLIVMGAHGRTPIERFVFGSVAECVLSRATCPVLVCRTDPDDHSGSGGMAAGRILCAIDFSKASLAALQYAVTLAKQAGAQVTVLYLIETLPESVRIDDALFAWPAHLRPPLRDAAGWLYSAITITPDWDARLEEEHVVSSENPSSAILDIARDQGFDLIILGARGRNPLTTSLFGSTAERVVRAATCPVLVITVPPSSGANAFATSATCSKEAMP